MARLWLATRGTDLWELGRTPERVVTGEGLVQVGWPRMDTVDWAECFVFSVYPPCAGDDVLCIAYDGIFGYFALMLLVELRDRDWFDTVERWRKEVVGEIMKCYEEPPVRRFETLHRFAERWDVPFGEYQFRVYTSEQFPLGWVDIRNIVA